MLKVIEVVFDGKAFVPTQPVDLPAGTKASVAVPEGSGAAPFVLAGPPPPSLTPEQRKEWEELCRLWAAEPPYFPTVEDAIAYSRGRPRPEPSEGGP